MNKRIYCKSFITQAFPGPLSRSNDSLKCFSHWLLAQETCLLVLWAAAKPGMQHLFLKEMILKRAGSSATIGQGQPPSCSSKFKLFFSSCKEQQQRIKKKAAEPTELNFWSPEHQDMMTLSDLNLCLFYPSRREVLCLLRLYKVSQLSISPFYQHKLPCHIIKQSQITQGREGSCVVSQCLKFFWLQH